MSISSTPFKPDIKSEAEADLRDRLLSLSYPAFEKVIEHLMTAMGYLDVASHREHFKGRNSGGGIDLAARARTGVTEVSVIAQIKLSERPVQKRYVDELRGTAMRCGARQGLIFTLSSFSPPARLAAATGQIIPIRLIDGNELLNLLFKHKIGISAIGSPPRLDNLFFDQVERDYPPADADDGRRKAPKSLKASRSTIETVNELGGFMTWRTHVLAGISSIWLLAMLPASIMANNEWSNFGVLATMAAFGALLPDLDAAQSKIKSLEIKGIRPFSPIADAAYRNLGHRGFLHSNGGLGVAGALCIGLSFLWGWEPSFALWLGYLSHLATDACTPAGIPLRPGDTKRFHLLPQRLRITTGSFEEDLLFPFLAGLALALLLSHLNQSGL